MLAPRKGFQLVSMTALTTVTMTVKMLDQPSASTMARMKDRVMAMVSEIETEHSMGSMTDLQKETQMARRKG